MQTLLTNYSYKKKKEENVMGTEQDIAISRANITAVTS